MDDNENRRHQMFTRVRDFGIAHAQDFAPNSIGRELFSDIASIVTELDGHAASQASGVGTARQGTTSRAQAREVLRSDLEAISRTARVMEIDVAGLENKFRIPRGTNDQLLLQAARAFAADSQNLSAEFIAHEMPANFRDELLAHIQDLEAAITHQSGGEGKHVAAGAAIDTTIGNGMNVVRKLDAIVKNKYELNPPTLAEWASASHTERAPRRNEAAPPPPPPSGGGPTPPA